MKTKILKKIDAIVQLHSSVSHIGGTSSIESEFRREKLINPEGRVIHAPVISGNSIRGKLRDLGCEWLLRRLKLSKPLSLSAFYTLFSGGSLSKSGSGLLKLGEHKALREELPILSLFGTAIGNYMLPGRLRIGKMIPITQETQHLMPPLHTHKAFATFYNTPPSLYDIMSSESFTRFDDAKKPQYGDLYSPDDNDKFKPQQMRYILETMAPGTQLWWRIILEYATELEELALVSAFSEWGKHPTIGGKSATGHGLVTVQFDNGWKIGLDDKEGCLLPSLSPYYKYIAERRDDILGRLNVL